MPRLQPAPGFITAKEAALMLNGSEAMLSRYVKKGKLKRYGPSERKYKFYKISEIEAVIAARNVFETTYTEGQWKENPSSIFKQAREEDLETIARISMAVFQDERNPTYNPTPIKTRLAWMRKNKDIYHGLYTQDGNLVGYICLLPLSKETIDLFITDKIKTTDITENEIEPFKPNHPIHLYIMAMCIDPIYPTRQKHEYGARLISGLFALLLDFATHNIKIETISARSYKPDGIRLLRKIGIPQLHSPIPNKNLFSVTVKVSGIPILEKYNELLNSKEDNKN